MLGDKRFVHGEICHMAEKILPEIRDPYPGLLVWVEDVLTMQSSVIAIPRAS